MDITQLQKGQWYQFQIEGADAVRGQVERVGDEVVLRLPGGATKRLHPDEIQGYKEAAPAG